MHFVSLNKTFKKLKIMGISLPIIIFLSVVLIAAGIFTVKQQSAAIIERFGKFHSIRQSGLHFKIPLIDKISGRLSLKIQQLDVLSLIHI